MSLLRKKTIVFRSRLDELSRIRSETENFIGNDLGSISKGRVVLSLDEAISNIIRHGYKSADDGIIELHMKRMPRSFSFVLTDNAPPFNPINVSSPDLETHFNNGREGGLGIDLFKRVMKVSYKLDKNGKNCLTLNKEISNEK